MKITDHYVFFWKSPLAQWNMKPFFETVLTHDKKSKVLKYCCAEQYMMAKKAKLFGDRQTFLKIMKSDSPKEIQELGRKISNFDQQLWDAHKQLIVYQGNILKFSQNEDLRNLLMSTKGKILVEASPIDKIWGIGLGENESEEILCDPKNWRGLNLLGFTLTALRDNYFTAEKML